MPRLARPRRGLSRRAAGCVVLVVQRVAVSSSSLVSIGYDATLAVLEAEFTGGAVYRYFGVPQSAYDAVVRAPSKGRAFNELVRPRYPCVRTY